MNHKFIHQLKNRVIQIFYSLSFKQRIRISFILLITLAISAAGTISYLIAAKEIQNNAFETSQETMNKSAQLMEDKLKNTAVSVRSLMLSDAFYQMMLDVQNNDITGYFRHLTALQDVFIQMSYNDTLIQNILIASPIGDFYRVTDYRMQGQSFYESELYDNAKKNKNGLWVKGHKDPFFSGQQRVLSFVVSGIHERLSTEHLNVFVIVNIKERELLNLINQESTPNSRDYFFINSKGEEIIRTEWSTSHTLEKESSFLEQVTAASQGSFFHFFNKANYLVNFTKLDIADDWILIGVRSKDQLLQQVNSIKRTTLYVILGFVLTSWLLSNKLTALLLKPLFRLQGLMRKVEDNQLSVRFESKFNDEVAQVGSQFNRMLDEINVLIENVKNSETGKRKAEMKALTAQMEPHFLYNTLNTIYCKSVLGENNDVNEMILALSQMFQLGLSGGKDLIPLEDELDHVKQYCAIQQKCYEGLFEYTIEVEDDSLLACYVPKILIQPLVENSILHGFKDVTSGGEIHIRVSRDMNQMMHLVIEDNGKGMDTAKTRTGMSQAGDSKKGYALRNIMNRLQLYYGNGASMELSNQQSGGSRIELGIPQQEGEQETYGE
jgi:two-component system sensor histidine kinase YesM